MRLNRIISILVLSGRIFRIYFFKKKKKEFRDKPLQRRQMTVSYNTEKIFLINSNRLIYLIWQVLSLNLQREPANNSTS